jgi:tetratricopeptide (TPR) repeat protein
MYVMTDTKLKPIQTNRVLIFVEFILNYFPVALTFLVPVFFLTTSTEYYEYNKFVLFLSGTILLTVFWILKLLLKTKVYITKSSLDTPIWLYLIVFTLSTLLSANQLDSIFGTQTKWVPSLIALVTFILYFYIISTNLRSLQAIKYSIYGFIAGGSISSLVAILSYYGLKLSSADFMSIPTFNLAGSLEIAGLVASVSFLFGVSVFYNTKASVNKGLSFLSIILNFMALTIIWHIPSLVLAIVGFIYINLTFVRNLKTVRTELITVTGFALVWIMLLSIPLTSKFIKVGNFQIEPTLDLQTSWAMAASVLRDRPIWGMGPNTFGMIFNQNKPLQMNEGPYWDYNFTRPLNQVLEDLSSLGLLGMLVSAYFIFRLFELVKHMFSKKEEFTPVHQALLIPIVGIPLYHLLANGSTQSNFIFYTYLGIFVSLVAGFGKDKKSEDIYISVKSFSTLEVSDQPETKEKFQYFAIIPLIGIASAIGYYSTFNIQGEYFFRKAINSALANDAYGVYNNQINARNAFPRRDAYHTAIAQTNLNLAITLANKPQLNDQEKEAVQTLISEAIRSTRLATENLNPLSLNNWVVRASIYRTLIGVTSDADQWTIGALSNAIQLDPANPNLRMDLGTIYFTKQDYLTAANLFKQATQLKPNYANAHYNLAQALIKVEAYDSAVSSLEITKSLLPSTSPDLDRLNKEIDDAKAKTKVAGASTERKSSVQELENKKSEDEKETTLTKPEELKKETNLEKVVNSEN